MEKGVQMEDHEKGGGKCLLLGNSIFSLKKKWLVHVKCKNKYYNSLESYTHVKSSGISSFLLALISVGFSDSSTAI